MSSKRLLKWLHFGGIAWFLSCAAVLVIIALRQAGVSWWQIFSISPFTIVLVFFLLTVYLYAMYQGIQLNKVQAEHPLTTSIYYMALYDIIPVLGSVAGAMACYGLSDQQPIQILSITTEGSLAATFLMWIIVDPLVGIIESLAPKSRQLQKERKEAVKAEKLREKQEAKQLLDGLFEKEKAYRQQWQSELEPKSEILARLNRQYLESGDSDLCKQAAEIGAYAWKKGGITCMRFLHSMTEEKLKKHPGPVIDFIPAWWDGIGIWYQTEISL